MLTTTLTPRESQPLLTFFSALCRMFNVFDNAGETNLRKPETSKSHREPLRFPGTLHFQPFPRQ